MADRGDTHYRVPHLNLWFAASSALFAISCFWMVIDDWSRPWKKHQREFREIEVARGRAELEEEHARAALADEARLTEVLAQTEAALEEREDEIAEVREELRLLKGDQFNATEAAKKAKQEFSWERYIIEEERLHLGDPEFRAEELLEYEAAFLAREGEKEESDLLVYQTQERLAQLTAEVTAAAQAVKDATKTIELTRSKLARIDPEDAPTQVANVIRDFPGMDFIGPSLQVQKVVLEDLTFELNFLRKKRIDMCMTCHVASDRGGYEDEEQPYASHPRLDLYLTAKSPHPLSEVGCTICHRGSGEALDFIRADHRPTDVEEGLAWYDETHWHKQHHWDYPMLRSGDIEAGCVQCHKTSMELIADDAPKVTDGFRNFERYGCYACHKVDWYPTKRRPGPSLKDLQQKTDKDFLASWVAAPRDFRPTTWMPQIFHLENFAATEEVAVSEYGTGRSILGQEWNDSLVAAVTEFVWDSSTKDAAAPIPVEGDSVRGAEVFRLSGCLACHNVALYEGEPDINDPALERLDENEHGPNLRGVATKVTPEWLFAWIKDPAAYWSETRMPNLRLDDQDAADIVAYMMEDPDGFFTDVPEGWEPTLSPYDREVLEEQARWYFSRDGRTVIADRFENEWSSDQQLLRDVGEKVVLAQGCHSCHEIDGLENAMPIGTELSTWTSKTVDKLDWGFIPEIMLEEGRFGDDPDEAYRRKKEFKHYREGWLAQKLHAPRSFDRRKEKNPLERLKMPWFDFDEETIAELSTFVLGLVEDEVQRARMIPDPGEAQRNFGLQAIRQKNCAACHVIEPGEVEFEDENGDVHRVRAEFLALEDEVEPMPMQDLDAMAAYLAEYEDYMEEEVEEIGLRLLETHPGVGGPGENIFVDPNSIRDVKAPWGGDFVSLVTNYYLFGQELYDAEADEYYSVTADPDEEGKVQDVDGEWRAYFDEPYDKVRWTFAPPVLLEEGHKLQKDWFYEFLVDPMPLREQVRVRMPTFAYNDGEAGAIADYFAHKAGLQWPSRYARELRVSLGLSAAEVGERANLTEAIVLAIENGDPVATGANLPKLVAFGNDTGFGFAPPVDPYHELIERRVPEHFAKISEGKDEWGGLNHIELGHLVAEEGPQCFQCHFYRGVAPLDGAAQPLAWAPDLYRVRERLREDWTEEWMWNPARKYPGTAMPSNFSPDPDQIQYLDLYPDSTSADQIGAVLDWLYNADREESEAVATN